MEYYATPETVNDILEKYGFAVLPSVLSPDKCVRMVSELWEFLEHITQAWSTPLNRDDTTTWREYYELYPNHSMLLQHHGIGHAPACWHVREDEAVVGAFAKIHGTDDLHVSFDGASVYLPHEITGRGKYRKPWYHTDQSPLRNDRECIQGFVTGMDIEEGDATLSVLAGSHLLHKKLQETFNLKEKKDWYKFTEEEVAFLIAEGCAPVNIIAPAGSLVLWDSRTGHCGKEADKVRANPKPRYVVYVCMLPARLTTAANKKKKIQALANLRTTSHWPNKPKLFGVKPQTYGKELRAITPIPPPVLSERALKLAGH